MVYVFYWGHNQTLIATLLAGALIFAATNIRKKLATIIIPTERPNHIAKRCLREVALVQKVIRSVELVRFHTLSGNYGPLGTHICCLPPFLWTQTDPENKVTGWCMNILTDVCCDQTTEETCYDSFPNGTYRSYCNKIVDGGCPCSGWGEGWEKCGQGKLLLKGYIQTLCLLVTYIGRVPLFSGLKQT